MLFTLLFAAAGAAATPTSIAAVLARLEADIPTWRDATFVLHRQEVVDGTQQPLQELAVKFQAPERLYLRWVGEVHRGRELLYAPPWNDGRLRVNVGPLVPNLDLEPLGGTAMRGSRHPVWMASPVRIARIIVDTNRDLERRGLEVTYGAPGPELVHGQPATCYRADLPKKDNPDLYAARVHICVDDATGLPSLSEAWDEVEGLLVKVEHYSLAEIRLNTGLDGTAFTPEHPDYGF